MILKKGSRSVKVCTSDSDYFDIHKQARGPLAVVLACCTTGLCCRRVTRHNTGASLPHLPGLVGRLVEIGEELLSLGEMPEVICLDSDEDTSPAVKPTAAVACDDSEGNDRQEDAMARRKRRNEQKRQVRLERTRQRVRLLRLLVEGVLDVLADCRERMTMLEWTLFTWI